MIFTSLHMLERQPDAAGMGPGSDFCLDVYVFITMTMVFGATGIIVAPSVMPANGPWGHPCERNPHMAPRRAAAGGLGWARLSKGRAHVCTIQRHSFLEK